MKKILLRRPVLSIDNLSQLHPVLQRIYAARGIQTLDELDYRLTRLLHYQDLMGIDSAAVKIGQVIMQGQRIVIIGDFDTDGATSSALAVSALRSFGANFVDYLVPNRFHYGYGLSPEIVAVAMNLKPNLIITVDNGISNHEGVSAAKQAGVTVIITDHHLPGSCLPNADVIVNPQQVGDRFASKNLAGVGVIFYVMLAVRSYLRTQSWFGQRGLPEPNMASFLDLVALGTVADLVPLDHNNRLLVYHGLCWIRSGKARPGIIALLDAAGRKASCATANDLSYSIAPRLNAAGRLTDMSLGIECLLALKLDSARTMAQQLSQLNQTRRVIEQGMQQQAWTILNKLENLSSQLGICLFNESWHQGVIGLLASRIKERYHRPSIIFAPGIDADELKASARSIPGLHIRDVLQAIAVRHPNLIIKFGGHAMAAGLTLQPDAFPTFCVAFQKELKNHLTADNLRPECLTDGTLSASDLTLELAECLQRAGPWGQAFPEPLFDGHFHVLDQRSLANKHLKFILGLEGTSRLFDAIAFNIDQKRWPNYRVEKIRSAYRLDSNEYKGRKNVQLVLEELEEA